MTHPISFQGSLTQYWEVLYTEYQRLTAALGQPPFEFMPSNPQTINDYIPKKGDEIIIHFWDKEHRQELLVVEAELLPDEDQDEVQVMVFPQGNPFQEPCKSAMSIWKEIKSALERAGGQADSTAHPKPKKKPKMQEEIKHKLEQLREFRLKKIKDTGQAPTKGYAMSEVDISYATCKTHDPQLLKYWKDTSYE